MSGCEHHSCNLLHTSSCDAGNFDYVPVETDVSFSKDAGLTQCVEIAIVSDGLSEADEQFHVNVLNGSEIVSSAVKQQ